jgi:DNA polymerase-1
VTSGVGKLRAFLVWDYSQIEIRTLAQVARDPLLIKQFQEAGYDSRWAKENGKDIHCQVGNTLTGWDVKRIAEDHYVRKAVKEFHFSIVFGVAKKSLKAHLIAKGVPANVAKNSDMFYDRYFQKYSGVRKLIEKCRKQAEREGFVETLFGFRRPILQRDDTRGSYWANQAINTPIQGSAHQLVLMAMALIHLYPKRYALLQDLVMEVHDALYFRVITSQLKAAYKQALQLLQYDVPKYAQKEFGVTIDVPLVAEAKAGYCLGSLVDYSGEELDVFLEAWRKKHAKVEAEKWEELLGKEIV